MPICIPIVNRVKVIITFIIDLIEWVVKTTEIRRATGHEMKHSIC